MITVTFEKDTNHLIRRIIVEGHASYADGGQDIVCAGVSILTISFLNGLEEIVQADISDREVDAGYTAFSIPISSDERQSIQIDALLRTYELGILSIAETYPDYLTVLEEKYGGHSND